eukprot:Nk52_evm7s1444 gene=Nk52_evmTU7s1444
MSDRRKLQAEIDRTIKKITEGAEEYENIWDKLHNASNVNQKEKYENDLKKEIKKLQRLREQIKTWCTSNEIKDKKELLANRKLIETLMERFKVVERETKTKAYSKEGLSVRMDPNEKAKHNTRKWINECVRNLNIQIDMCESETEALSGKKKKGNSQRLTELDEAIERHKWHTDKLEIILRKLDNGEMDPQSVDGIKEDIEYYIESNQDPDFAENEYLYDELDLEENENENSSTPVSDYKASKERIDDDVVGSAGPSSKTGRSDSVNSLASRSSQGSQNSLVKSTLTSRTEASNDDDKKRGKPDDSDVRPKTRQGAMGTKYSTLASSSPKQGSTPNSPSAPGPRPVRSQQAAQSPLPAYAAAAAAAASSSSGHPTALPSTSFQTSSHNPHASTGPPRPVVGHTAGGPDVMKGPGPLSYANRPFQQSTEIDGQNKTVGGNKDMRSMAGLLGSEQSSQGPQGEKVKDVLQRSQGPDSAGVQGGMPMDERIMALQVLEAGFRTMPEIIDDSRSKSYAPRNPYMTPPYYPQAPFSLSENPSLIKNFDVDTLFFIFYYQQGTYQQYLAARELKNQSWRFHKKYSTWFQRHEEPKAITDEYEQGTYVYFDYETGWCQRKKTEFSFEYRYLEDHDLA